MSAGTSAPDARLLRRASRRVAAQTAAAVAVVVLTMAAAVLLIDEHQQQAHADQVTRTTWANADDVGDPGAGTWLVVQPHAGVRQVTPGAPSVVAGLDPRTLHDGASRVVRDGQELAVWTGDRRIGRVSAVFDLSPRELEEQRLLVSLGAAALLGVAGAAAVGALIGRRAVRPLGEALGLQRRFVADASHELRTPLTVLLTRAQLLRRRTNGTLSPEDANDLDRLVQDAKVLGDVVNDLLLSTELQHREQGGTPVDLVAVATDVTHSLQPLAQARSVELSVSSPASTGPGPATVTGAPAALRRAITSLVDNAIAHTPPAGHVRVAVRSREDDITVAVVDDGEGLDPGQAHRLVERFARGTASQSGRRFGLGLALVDEVARAHGGSLSVDGAPGAGASFTLRLPRSR
jgi:two-component system, OmpR family, sensor kinase